jgi:hypothetical protein
MLLLLCLQGSHTDNMGLSPTSLHRAAVSTRRAKARAMVAGDTAEQLAVHDARLKQKAKDSGVYRKKVLLAMRALEGEARGGDGGGDGGVRVWDSADGSWWDAAREQHIQATGKLW